MISNIPLSLIPIECLKDNFLVFKNEKMILRLSGLWAEPGLGMLICFTMKGPDRDCNGRFLQTTSLTMLNYFFVVGRINPEMVISIWNFLKRASPG